MVGINKNETRKFLHMKIATKSIFTAVLAIAASMWCGQLGAQSLAPQATLHSGSAIEVQAEENYVMQQPAPAAVPFRSTISASAMQQLNKLRPRITLH